MKRSSKVFVFAIACLMSCLLFRAAYARDEKPKTDEQKWQGTWKLTKLENRKNGGVAYLTDVKGTAVFEGDKAKVKVDFGDGGGEKEIEYTFKLNPEASPKAFDVTYPDGKTLQGIYKFDGNQLIRCHSQTGEDRPKDFDDGMYSVWTREEPTDK